MRPATKTKGIRIQLIKTDFADRSVTETPPVATSRDDICSTTSVRVRRSTGPNEPDGCAVGQRPLRGSFYLERCQPRNDPWSLFHQSNPYPPGFCSRLRQTSRRVGWPLSRNPAMSLGLEWYRASSPCRQRLADRRHYEPNPVHPLPRCAAPLSHCSGVGSTRQATCKKSRPAATNSNRQLHWGGSCRVIATRSSSQ